MDQFRWVPLAGRAGRHREGCVFDHDLDQSLLVLLLPLLALFALPFAMAWLEESLETRPWGPSRAWAAVEAACAEAWSRGRSAWSRR